MGRAKEEYMRMLEGGWHSIGRKSVCSNCVDDYALKAFIEEDGTESRCDYCDENSEDIVVVDSDTLLEFIAEGVRTEYEDPSNSVGWCSEEGGWLLPTMDSYDLLGDLGLGNFYDDAALAFSDHDWVERDPYGDRAWEWQLSRWSKFCRYVKHDRRFFFHGGSKTESNASLVDILDDIGRVAMDAKRPKRPYFCRGRVGFSRGRLP